MNFIEEFKYGQKGGNKGLSLGPGLENLSKAIGGLQRKMMIAIASAPKTGKSTLVDYGFIIHPWLRSSTMWLLYTEPHLWKALRIRQK